MKQPLRVGIIGMGGFAAAHHATVARLEERDHCRLICTCDPQASMFAVTQQSWRLAERRVRVFEDYRKMIESCGSEVDFVVIPTPIVLHAAMHAEAAARGIASYIEKPPTLDYVELESMIAADSRARKAALVGFNFIVEKPRRALKERLLSGEFGALRGATLTASWPRPASYFTRNNWAGRLVADGRVVLDSCLGNAMAHFVHNLLFWVGSPGLSSWSPIAAVRAELYRAHAIEGADTFFVEADLPAGGSLRIAVTHACTGQAAHAETVLCDKATLRYVVGGPVEIGWKDGRVERIVSEPFDGLVENHLDYYRYLRGETDRPATTLADSRPFVVLNDLAHVSSGRILPIPPHLVKAVRDEKDQKDYLDVPEMPQVIDRFVTRGLWPGANGWGRPNAEVVTPADLPRFHDIVRAMAAG